VVPVVVLVVLIMLEEEAVDRHQVTTIRVVVVTIEVDID